MSRLASMNTLLVCTLLVAAQVHGERINLHRRLAVRAPFGNDTALSDNTTSILTSSTTSNTAQLPTTIATNEDTSPAPPNTLSDGGSSIPPLPGNNDSGGDASNPPGDGGGECDGSVMTYFGSVYPTVYMTVTETFDVTLSAANATMTEGETLITPSSPSACRSTVVPIDGPGQAVATILATFDVPVTDSSTTDDSTTFSTFSAPANQTHSVASGDDQNGIDGSRGPLATGRPPPKGALPPAPEAQTPESPDDDNGLNPTSHLNYHPTVVPSTIYATAPYTSTVIVTKKTPVPVVPRSQEPPVVFQPASPPANNPPPSSPPSNNAPGGNPNRGPGGAPAGGPNVGSQVNTLIVRPSAAPAPGNLIDTIIRSIIIQQSPTQAFAPQTTLNNVPVAVRPSSVVIGNSAVPIPTGRDEAVVTEGGAVFTVRPSEIVADATTVAFGPLSPQEVISVAPTRVTAAPGVVVAVAGSTAVVDGTTFRLDASFSTIVTVSGERISIGPSGIGLPDTTIAISPVTEAPQIVQSVGDVTFTLQGSEVVISGTRFGIGSDSPTITTEFSGERISIGPGGIGFDSTTISPTSGSTSTSSSPDVEATSSGDTTENEDSGDGNNSSGASVFRLSGYTTLLSLLAFVLFL
jgi:hypothetical protein